jgi:hypothetical protein
MPRHVSLALQCPFKYAMVVADSLSGITNALVEYLFVVNRIFKVFRCPHR